MVEDTDIRVADLERELAAVQATLTEVRAQAAYYQDVVNNVSVAIFALDRAGVYTLTEGRETLALTGVRPGERLGQSLLALYADRPEIANPVRQALAGSTARFVVTVRSRTIETTLTPLFDDVGAVRGVTGVVVDITERVRALEEREQLIRAQEEAIRALSTPVLQVRERVLLVPLIGEINETRAQQLKDHLLPAIRTARARVVVLDVTGVPVIDTMAANHLLQTAEAMRLMGARVLLTGLSTQTSRMLVSLGVDLTAVATMGDLQEGLAAAERLLWAQPAERRAPAS